MISLKKTSLDFDFSIVEYGFLKVLLLNYINKIIVEKNKYFTRTTKIVLVIVVVLNFSIYYTFTLVL